MQSDVDYDVAREWMHRRPLVVLTGAGISTEYGIPTFQSEDGGRWAGTAIQDVLTPEAFRTDPRMVWDWHLEMRRRISSIKDIPIHTRLAEWTRGDERIHVVTQNIDGLHEQAGQERLIRLHGSLWSNRCLACQRTHSDLTLHYETLPRCPHCRDGKERPNVVWYGESLDRKLYRCAEALVSAAAMLLVVGTSGRVYPAASLITSARGQKVLTININPQDSEVTSDLSIRLPVSEAWHRLLP